MLVNVFHGGDSIICRPVLELLVLLLPTFRTNKLEASSEGFYLIYPRTWQKIFPNTSVVKLIDYVIIILSRNHLLIDFICEMIQTQLEEDDNALNKNVYNLMLLLNDGRNIS